MSTISKQTAIRLFKASTDDEKRVCKAGKSTKDEYVGTMESLRECARNFAEAFGADDEEFLTACGFGDDPIGEVAQP